MKNLILQKIEQAFMAKPRLDGILYGVREIQQGKQGSRSSLFFSAKNQALMPVESRLEKAYCYQLEADPSVKQYRTQALQIPFRRRPLFPDFLILTCNGVPYVREVKSSNFINTATNVLKATYLSSVFSEAGISFEVTTECDFWKRQEQINRVMAYDRGGRYSPTSALYIALVDIVAHLDPTLRTVGRIRVELERKGLPAYLLEAAIFSGKLNCDMNRPLAINTKIEVAS